MSPYAHLGQCIILGVVLAAVVWLLIAFVVSDLRENPAPEVYDDEGLDEFDDQDDYRDGAYTGDEWDRAYDRWIDEQTGVA